MTDPFTKEFGRDFWRRLTEIGLANQAERAAFKANPIAAFRAEVIDRALAHGQWHIDRGIVRSIETPEAEAAESAFMTALLNLGDAKEDAARDAASEAAHETLSQWKSILEDLSDGPDDPSTDQCVELDQGDLLSLLRCVDALDYLASEECQSRITPLQIMTDVAAQLFACPGFPDREDV